MSQSNNCGRRMMVQDYEAPKTVIPMHSFHLQLERGLLDSHRIKGDRRLTWILLAKGLKDLYNGHCCYLIKEIQ